MIEYNIPQNFLQEVLRFFAIGCIMKYRERGDFMKRIAVAFFLILLFLGTLIGCGVKPQHEEKALLDLSVGDYAIIHPETRRGELRGAVLDLLDEAKDRSMPMTAYADTDREASEKEILVGATNRPETAEAISIMGDDDYIVTVIGEKLVIYAAEDEGYAFAMRWLFNNLEKEIFAVSKDLHYQSKTVTEKVFDTVVSSRETLTLSFKLLAAESVLTLYLGKEDATAVNGYNGYSAVITGTSITFFRQ